VLVVVENGQPAGRVVYFRSGRTESVAANQEIKFPLLGALATPETSAATNCATTSPESSRHTSCGPVTNPSPTALRSILAAITRATVPLRRKISKVFMRRDTVLAAAPSQSHFQPFTDAEAARSWLFSPVGRALVREAVQFDAEAFQ